MSACHPTKPLAGKGLCKSCYYKKYRKKHPDRAKASIRQSRNGRLLREFGIDEAQWDRIFTLQNGLCPICSRQLYRPYNEEGRRCAAVDHDHKTGRVRGLLCWQCNSLRVSNNTIETAKNMVKYLESDFDGRSIRGDI